MKRLLYALAALTLSFSVSSGAFATIINALPYNFTNGSLADATQVMANYDEIVTDVNTNGAHNGVNSDITSITGLTTALPPSEGGTVVYTGGTTAGSANAQTLVTVTPSAFALTAGNIVTGIAGASNTTTATLATNGTTAKTVKYTASTGLANLYAGAITSGGAYAFLYDGTQYQLLNPTLAASTALLNIQVFQTPGDITYTPTAGMTKAVVKMVGGGGASGSTTGAGGQSATGGAGGGADTTELFVTAAQIGVSAAGHVGAAGAAGSSGNNPGGPGAATTFTIGGGTPWQAGPGLGGLAMTSSASAQVSGAPGAGGTITSGTNATLIADHPGQAGGYGQSNGAVGGAVSSWSGKGGDSQEGRGAPQGIGACAVGLLYGAGASGYYNASGSNQAGCNGAIGEIIVYEYK